MYIFRYVVGRLLCMIGAGGMLAGIGTGEIFAQRFEYAYGGPNCTESGRGGVQQVSEGGYITVGETFSNQSGTCSDADVYLVRTQADGSLAWSQSYDIGGSDYGLNIQEVQCDPSGRGGFIITGYTEYPNSRCGLQEDLFLLRVDRCGNIIWANTYGTRDYREVGWDVTEACTPGDPAFGTSAGDFIAVGYAARSAAGDIRDGYLVRVEGTTGALIWDATYNGPRNGDDYLYGVDETFLYSLGSTGDIVAAGGSNSYYTDSYDGWVIRVDGNTGGFTGGDQGAAAYGWDGFEEFRSIQELLYSGWSGDLVMTGTSTTLAGERDVYVVQTTSRPCGFVNDLVFGDLGTLPDEGYCVRELPFDTPIASTGDLVITGYMVAPDGLGHGMEDVFLAHIYIVNFELIPNSGVMLYGGAETDRGWSVGAVSNANNPRCATNGFIASGWTSSSRFVAAGDPRQLYLIKTDDLLRDDCTSMEYEVRQRRILWRECDLPQVGELGGWCEAPVEKECQYWQTPICRESDLPEECRIERCECSTDAPKRDLKGEEKLLENALSLGSYPNPVGAGGTVTLNYTLEMSGEVNIHVHDPAGRTIYDRTIRAVAGRGAIDLPTEGWGSGRYMVTITSGGRTAGTSVVVTE